jgi:hypothetical protein
MRQDRLIVLNDFIIFKGVSGAKESLRCYRLTPAVTTVRFAYSEYENMLRMLRWQLYNPY